MKSLHKYCLSHSTCETARMSCTFCAVFVITYVLIKAGKAEPPVVDSPVGTIIGTYKEVDVFGENKTVENYLGIPYAEPPLGDLRFKDSIRRQNFTMPFNATTHGMTCWQMRQFPLADRDQSEDCLFLNIYVPAERNEALAVMIFIHGGGLLYGYSDQYVSNTLSLYGNVIVVTFNYRLSILGWLSTEDEFCRGNFGLSDQHLVIKWVHENIAAFGGDPSRVTLFGQSAGSVSAIIQGLYVGNEELIHRVIAQSGSLVPRPWDIDFANPRKDARDLARLVGCPAFGSNRLINCLRNVPAEVLYETINNFDNGFIRFPAPFILNVVDDEYVKVSTYDMLFGNNSVTAPGQALFSTLDFLTGFDAREGCVMMSLLVGVADPDSFEPNRTYYNENLIPEALAVAFGLDSAADVPELVADVVRHQYTHWPDPELMEAIRDQFASLHSDIAFTEIQLQTVVRHASLSQETEARTYLYYFDVLPSAHPMPSPAWCVKASHGDEMVYEFFEETDGLMTFVPGYENWTAEEWERDMAKTVMALWANFAKTG